MTANTEIEFTPAQTAHRRACAFLKGILCGYSDKKGRTYASTREVMSPDFAAGFAKGQDAWTTGDDITANHILHNRLRNRPPHISEEHDAQAWLGFPKSALKAHLGDGLYDALEGNQ